VPLLSYLTEKRKKKKEKEKDKDKDITFIFIRIMHVYNIYSRAVDATHMQVKISNEDVYLCI